MFLSEEEKKAEVDMVSVMKTWKSVSSSPASQSQSPTLNFCFSTSSVCCSAGR